MSRRRSRALAAAIALLVGAALVVAPAAPRAGAVVVVQHALPAGAQATSPEAVLATSEGLVIPPTAPGSAFEAVRTRGGPSFATGPSGAAATRLAPGPDGDLWYVSTIMVREPAGQELPYAAIFEVTPFGVLQRARYASTADAPVDMARGPDGAVWLANDGSGDSVDRYERGGPIVKHHTPGPPLALTAGPDGAIWFTDAGPCPGYGGPCIGRIGTGGELTYFPLPWSSGPAGITVGADGALWFAEWQAPAIGRMTAQGELRQFPVPSPGGRPVGDGGPTPTRVAAAADGSIWFTDPGDGAVGEVSASGAVAEYPIASPAGHGRLRTAPPEVPPEGIAAGPEGLLWVTEGDGRAIASVDPGASAPATSAAVRPRTNRARGSRRRTRRCPRGPRSGATLTASRASGQPTWTSTRCASGATCSGGRSTGSARSRCWTHTSRRAATSSIPRTAMAGVDRAGRGSPSGSSGAGWRSAGTGTSSS